MSNLGAAALSCPPAAALLVVPDLKEAVMSAMSAASSLSPSLVDSLLQSLSKCGMLESSAGAAGHLPLLDGLAHAHVLPMTLPVRPGWHALRICVPLLLLVLGLCPAHQVPRAASSCDTTGRPCACTSWLISSKSMLCSTSIVSAGHETKQCRPAIGERCLIVWPPAGSWKEWSAAIPKDENEQLEADL